MSTHPWYNLRLPFFSPLCYLRVNLVSELRLDLSGIPSEEREEALRPAVDDVDLVQGDGVDDLLAFLDFTLWALYKLRLHEQTHDIHQ